MTGRCTTTVYWWDLGVTVTCVRPLGHSGLHRDGTRWFDDTGLQRPQDTARPRSLNLPAPAPGHRRRHPSAKLTDDDVREIRRRYSNGFKVTDIAGDLAIDYQTVYNCARGITYRDVA